jgi:TonB family protein
MTIRHKNINLVSSLFSVSMHVIVAIVLLIWYSLQVPAEELIQIGFGEPGGGSGGFGPMPSNIDLMTAIPNKPVIEETKKEDVEKDPQANVPETKNNVADAEDKISTKTTKGKVEKESGISRALQPAGNNKEGKGIGNGRGTGSGIGNGIGNGIGDGMGDGIGINWGGRKRQIYSYPIPDYPSGVAKDIDVKLRFSILPDGSVGKITILQKVDSRLEQVATDALRLWRFEPLPSNSEQKVQIAEIKFPFRLK